VDKRVPAFATKANNRLKWPISLKILSVLWPAKGRF
jgi:hypothetical protein